VYGQDEEEKERERGEQPKILATAPFSLSNKQLKSHINPNHDLNVGRKGGKWQESPNDGNQTSNLIENVEATPVLFNIKRAWGLPWLVGV